MASSTTGQAADRGSMSSKCPIPSRRRSCAADAWRIDATVRAERWRRPSRAPRRQALTAPEGGTGPRGRSGRDLVGLAAEKLPHRPRVQIEPECLGEVGDRCQRYDAPYAPGSCRLAHHSARCPPAECPARIDVVASTSVPTASATSSGTRATASATSSKVAGQPRRRRSGCTQGWRRQTRHRRARLPWAWCVRSQATRQNPPCSRTTSGALVRKGSLRSTSWSSRGPYRSTASGGDAGRVSTFRCSGCTCSFSMACRLCWRRRQHNDMIMGSGVPVGSPPW